MRFIVFTLLGLFFGHIYSVAQSNKTDSLLRAIQGTKGKDKIKILLNLCEVVRKDDKIASAKYAREGLRLSIAHKEPNLIAAFYRNLGRIKRSEEDSDSALYFFERALISAELTNNIKEKIDAYNGIGVIHEQQGRITEAMSSYLKALHLCEVHGDSLNMANTHNEIGFVYKLQKDFDLALESFNKALIIRRKIDDPISIAGSLNNIGLIYIEKSEYGRARKLFLEAASALDTAIHLREFAMVYNNIGITYEDEGEHVKAHEYYLKSLHIKQLLKDKRGIASSYGNIGANLKEEGRYKEAIPFLMLSYNMSKEIGSLDMMINATRNLSRCYKGEAAYTKAIQYMEETRTLEDSLFNIDKAGQIAEMTAKYEAQKKDRENESLRNENLLKKIQARNNLLAFFIALLLTVIVIGFTIVLWRRNLRKTKVNALLNTYNKQIEETNLQLQESINENNNLMNVVAHDLKSPLNKVKGLLQLVSLDGELNTNQQLYIQKVDYVIEQGRRLISDLLIANRQDVNGHTYETIDIVRLVQDLQGEFSRQAHEKKINLQFQSDVKELQIVSVKDHILRIMDNLISNAIKFSPQNKNVFVSIHKHTDFVWLSVKDEGPGFTEDDRKLIFKKFQRLSAQPTAGESSTGLGLTIVKQLCNELQGEIELQSNSNGGAQFTIKLPIKLQKKIIDQEDLNR